MADVTVMDVDSVWQFSKAIEELLAATRTRTGQAADHNWYRGHGRAETFVLKPTLYRHPERDELEALLDLETHLVNAFMSHHLLHSFTAGSDQSGKMNTLFYMQHYGVPTRLLDWTNNPLIALYFAVSDARLDRDTGKYPEPAAVWVLDPASWNVRALDGLRPPHGALNSSNQNLESYIPRAPWTASDRKGMYAEPVAITGGANTQRMLAQRGVFTMFGSDIRSMDALYTANDYPEGCLTKLVVPSDSISSVLGTLHAMGYTDSVAYPDLHGLALELKRLNGFNL
jgi:hypothetical protein